MSVRKTVYLSVAAVAVVLGLTVNKVFMTVPLSKAQLQHMGAVLFETPRKFEMAPLETHQGGSFELNQFNDKWTLLYFGFTFCPDICPTTLSQLNKLDQLLKEKHPKLAKKLQYVMVTVDPRRDTAEKLNGYVPYFNPEFIGVTGGIEHIYQLAVQMNVPFTPVIEPDDEFYLVDHGANLALINPHGHHHGFLRPPFDAQQMAQVLQQLN